MAINYGLVGPQTTSDGGQAAVRLGRTGEQVFNELHGRYYEQAVRGKLFMAQAIVTAPVIYTTAAGTGGPLLWNPPSSGINAVILAVSMGISVVTTVAAALGITGNSGQSTAPSSTTAIDGRACLNLSGASSTCTPYRIGTVSTAGAFLLPFGSLHTGALTVDTGGGVGLIDIGGMVVVPPGSWAAIAASATASTTVGTFGMVWEEVPV